MHIYKGRFVPDKPIVANDANNSICKASSAWFISLYTSNININTLIDLYHVF